MRLFTTIFGIVLLAAATTMASADQGPNALLIMGSGYTGTYNTEIVVANPQNVGLDVQIGGFPTPVFCNAEPCPPPDPVNLHIPPNGQIQLDFTDIFVSVGTVLQPLYVLATNPADHLPVVRARVFSVAQPWRAMELPIVSYASLLSHRDTPLAFPGALRSATTHSNLAIGEVSRTASALVRLEAISAAGTTVSTMNVALSLGQTILLGDVLGTMGLQAFDGQLRATQIGGDGVVDGMLAVLFGNGGYAISAGFNP